MFRGDTKLMFLVITDQLFFVQPNKGIRCNEVMLFVFSRVFLLSYIGDHVNQ